MLIMQNQLNLYKKRGYQIIIIGFVGFFLWAGLYQINQGVYSQGFIVSKNEKVEMISPINGLIDVLNIAPGKLVNKGDILVSFNQKALQSKINALNNTILLKEQNRIILENYIKNIDIVKINHNISKMTNF